MINSFQGEWRWLSNFWLSQIVISNVSYRSVEHFYQVMKTVDLDWRIAIRNCPTPGKAKRLALKAPLRPNWETIQIPVMWAGLTAKFDQHPYLAKKLLATDPQELIEGNTWNDTFWGVYKGEGQNNLGKLLMRKREHLGGSITPI